MFKESFAPREYFTMLMENGHFPDAVRFLAHALPKREAVWWAWICARRAGPGEPSDQLKASLDATEAWITQPNDEKCRAAMKAAEAAGVGTAAGCAGLAAFFSGESLAPPGAATIPPGPGLTAKAVSGAVILAAVAAEPATAQEKFRAFLEQGLDVVNRIQLWR